MNKAQQYKQEWADARQAYIEAQHEQDRLDELEGYSLYEDILLQEHEEQQMVQTNPAVAELIAQREAFKKNISYIHQRISKLTKRLDLYTAKLDKVQTEINEWRKYL